MTTVEREMTETAVQVGLFPGNGLTLLNGMKMYSVTDVQSHQKTQDIADVTMKTAVVSEANKENEVCPYLIHFMFLGVL